MYTCLSYAESHRGLERIPAHPGREAEYTLDKEYNTMCISNVPEETAVLTSFLFLHIQGVSLPSALCMLGEASNIKSAVQQEDEIMDHTLLILPPS